MNKEKYAITCGLYKDWASTFREAKIKALQQMLCAQTEARLDVDLVAVIMNTRINEAIFLSFGGREL